MLQSPDYAQEMASRGLSVPAYAYGLNNPLRWVDVNGLDPGDPFDTPEEAVRDAWKFVRETRNPRWEQAGTIYKWKKKFYSTAPYTQESPTMSSVPSCPRGTERKGDWHTHPGGNGPSDTDLGGYLDYNQPGWILFPNQTGIKVTPKNPIPLLGPLDNKFTWSPFSP